MNTHRWVDLSGYDMKLEIAQISSGQRVLHVQNGEKQPEALEKLGFQKDESGQWFNLNCKNIVPRDFLRELSRGKITQLPVEKIFATEIDTSNLSAPTESYPTFNDKFHIPVGINHLRQMVYKNDQEIRYTLDKNDKPLWETTKSDALPATFLRTNSPEDLVSCVEGFIETINSDKLDFQTSLEKFSKTCGIDNLKNFLAVIENSITRRVLRQTELTIEKRVKECIPYYNVLNDSPIRLNYH